MNNNNWFEDWFSSPYYHMLYKNRDNSEASFFIDNLINYLNPSGNSKMLDVACGKGRHSFALANKGFDVTGIDIAFPSIDEAKKMEHERLHFYQHDMRLPFWINYFDYAFNFFTSFGYFKTEREHNNALRTIAQSIKPKGTLVIDYLNVAFIENSLQPLTITTVDDVEFTISRWHTENHFYKKIQVKENNEVRDLYTECVAKFSLANFEEMLALQNMKVKEVFGNYDLSSYNKEQSPRLIIVAERNK